MSGLFVGGKSMDSHFYSRNEPAIPRVSDKQPEKCRGCCLGTWTGVVQMCIMPRCWKSNHVQEKVTK